MGRHIFRALLLLTLFLHQLYNLLPLSTLASPQIPKHMLLPYSECPSLANVSSLHPKLGTSLLDVMSDRPSAAVHWNCTLPPCNTQQNSKSDTSLL